MTPRFFRGKGDKIVAALGVLTLALMLAGVGYVTGKAHQRIAQERACRPYTLECLAQDRGYVIDRMAR